MNIALHLNSNLLGNKHSLMSTYKPMKCPKISCRSNYSSTTRDRHVTMYGNNIKQDYYELLSLGSRDVGVDEIKKAYRGMALRCHPDVACPKGNDPSVKDESTRRFIELRKAYETLSDPVSRELYDYELSLTGQNRANTGLGIGAPGFTGRRSSSVFSKEVLENQLRGLRRRSRVRMKRRN